MAACRRKLFMAGPCRCMSLLAVRQQPAYRAGWGNWIYPRLSARKERTASRSCGRTANASSAEARAQIPTARAGPCWRCWRPGSIRHRRPSTACSLRRCGGTQANAVLIVSRLTWRNDGLTFDVSRERCAFTTAVRPAPGSAASSRAASARLPAISTGHRVRTRSPRARAT